MRVWKPDFQQIESSCLLRKTVDLHLPVKKGRLAQTILTDGQKRPIHLSAKRLTSRQMNQL